VNTYAYYITVKVVGCMGKLYSAENLITNGKKKLNNSLPRKKYKVRFTE